MWENLCSYLEGFIIMQFSEYNQGARSGSPNRECPRSSTSPRKQVFWLINHWMNNPTLTTANSTDLRHFGRDCVTLSGSPAPNLSHEILLALPLGPVLALLAFASTSGASASAPKPSASHTLASPGFAQLLAAFA